ncbi:MAG TPA: type II toxin-antitoxin system HipA family toxin [Solirubrobacteraceae bacterium]|jgi:serine/threonine-protein kinase HipA|nr:type II toxin-antitoxin system HipA family toxin [Solirubrobacteraceae bacterium]
MKLGIYWDGREVGQLQRVDERSREYVFAYTPQASRPISLSLPLRQESFDSPASRPFFEALLPEGAIRDQIASQLKLAASDSFGLLAELGRDCAGALQIVESSRMSQTPSVQWLDDHELDALIEQIPRHPLGIQRDDEHLRLSLAGVQRKAVLVREQSGRFGRPLDGMPSTHILKPELPDNGYPGLAANECFCMRLARRCGLSSASVELLTLAGRPCLVVERFDRELSSWPPRRLHQEDLCQALGLTPDFKYQHEGWRLPSYQGLAELLSAHSLEPGVDRLAGAQAAVFHFLVGNADAHAKNISLLHHARGVGLAPLYDVVSTAAYPELSTELALGIGDELDPNKISSIHWSDLAEDFGLNVSAFARVRRQLTERVASEAIGLRDEARAEGWHHPCIDVILEVIATRSPRAV